MYYANQNQSRSDYILKKKTVFSQTVEHLIFN